MSKRRKKKPVRRPAGIAKPRRHEYVAPPCSQCEAVRPPGTNYSRVYGNKKSGHLHTRYCRCGFCGHTFKDTQIDPSGVEDSESANLPNRLAKADDGED